MLVARSPRQTNGFRRTMINDQRKYSNSCKRLKQDYLMHYVLRGPENSVYHGGIYHGKLRFPAEFPFKPPSIYMMTPSGRFETNQRLCLSFSDFHPDSWNPTWSLSTILAGLLSFMLEEDVAVGSIQTTEHERKTLAKKSLQFNLKNPLFQELFPEISDEIKAELEQIKSNDAIRLQNNLKSIKNRLGGIQTKGSKYDRYRPILISCIYHLFAIVISKIDLNNVV
ncbi:ubiquitin-conjugating enzyme E2 J2-like protein [Sarcoptes scabiei]|uniref:Ubiquitin-conjugating enzyme E2 J2-like protein n=1 Tax=Sarcoptes scabiei TaxID=52283 RepID=A0A132AJA7_SARSC|nr:ubiquitin-conjugating enzyme E2 J2-like protein [Sarcoptes scabiei]